MDVICEVGICVVKELEPQGVSMTARSSAVPGMRREPLMDALAWATTELRHQLTPQNAANAAWGLAASALLSTPLASVLAEEAQRMVQEFDGQETANTAWSCGRAMLRPALRCEQKRKMRQRSIAIQGVLAFLAFGWILALCRLLGRCLHALCNRKAGERRRVAKAESGGPPRPKHRRCGGLQRLLERCYVWRAFLYWTGLGGRAGQSGDDSKLVDAAKRSAGGGAKTLEETLAQFGLDTVVTQESKTFQGALHSLLTDGYEEITQEAGWTGADIEDQIPERDLELEDEDRDMRPSVEVEDMEMNECEEEMHIS